VFILIGIHACSAGVIQLYKIKFILTFVLKQKLQEFSLPAVGTRIDKMLPRALCNCLKLTKA
jgi:hypothetical protein